MTDGSGSVAVAETPDIALPATGSTVGIDVGIARFLTTSNGEIVANPRFLKNASDELAHLQRRYAESGRRSKQLRRAIRKLHAKITNQRLDFHHQTARRLVNQHDVIVLEDLNVRAMSQRAKVKPDPNNPDVFLPNGQAAKSGLNKSISDVGWSQFRTILNLKAASAGRRVEFVNPAHTSIRCNMCQATCLRPEQSVVICPEHGPIDADLNGAINILGRGLASSAAA